MAIIKTKDFTLRPIRISDAQKYADCHKDEDAKKNFFSAPSNIKEAEKELSENKKFVKRFAIIVNKEFAGFMTLKLNNVARYKHSAIIGYGLLESFRGKGIATKAVKTLTKYAFDELKLTRITGWCRTFNKASARVLEKSGYKLEGILRKNKYVDGKYFDDMVWSKNK